jgi:hypothetical protein
MLTPMRASADAAVSGAGWAVASIGLFAVAMVGVNRSAVPTFVAALILAALAFGLPIYAAAGRTGGRWPQFEAAAWTTAAAVATLLFFTATRPEPSFVNAVTLDRAGAAVSPYWPYPPELVWGVRCLGLFALAAGIASAALNAHAAGLVSVLWRGLVFGVCIAVILAVSLLVFAIGGPILWKIVPLPSAGVAAAAFASGCLAGAWISRARLTLITPLSRR